jgi:hypothetical protein
MLVLRPVLNEEYDPLSPGSKSDDVWTWTNENENELDESIREDGIGIAFRIGMAWHGMARYVVSYPCKHCIRLS